MVILKGDGASYALQKLAREQMKTKLLADINTDMRVCQIEGWDHTEFLHDLHEEIEGLCPCLR